MVTRARHAESPSRRFSAAFSPSPRRLVYRLPSLGGLALRNLVQCALIPPHSFGKHAIAKRKTAGRLRGHADGAVSFGVLFFPLCPPVAWFIPHCSGDFRSRSFGLQPCNVAARERPRRLARFRHQEHALLLEESSRRQTQY